MRQVQITTEAGVSILLVMMLLAIIFMVVQKNKFSDTLDEINSSVQKNQQAVNGDFSSGSAIMGK